MLPTFIILRFSNFVCILSQTLDEGHHDFIWLFKMLWNFVFSTFVKNWTIFRLDLIEIFYWFTLPLFCKHDLYKKSKVCFKKML